MEAFKAVVFLLYAFCFTAVFSFIPQQQASRFSKVGSRHSCFSFNVIDAGLIRCATSCLKIRRCDGFKVSKGSCLLCSKRKNSAQSEVMLLGEEVYVMAPARDRFGVHCSDDNACDYQHVLCLEGECSCVIGYSYDFDNLVCVADCPLEKGYINESNVCYRVLYGEYTFAEVKKLCEKDSGRLAMTRSSKKWLKTSFFKKGLIQKGADVAAAKPTTQSSTFITLSYSSYAVDGIEDSRWSHGHCSATHDDNTTTHWWQVDTGYIYRIGEIHILPRIDINCRDVRNFLIHVYRTEPGTKGDMDGDLCVDHSDRQLPSGTWSKLRCRRPVFGRYVRITKRPGFFGLTLCEVKVRTAGVSYYTHQDRHVGSSSLAVGMQSSGEECLLMISERQVTRKPCNQQHPGICEIVLSINTSP